MWPELEVNMCAAGRVITHPSVFGVIMCDVCVCVCLSGGG